MNNRRFNFLLGFAFTACVFSAAGSVRAEPAKEETIREYVKVSGEEERATVATQSVLLQIKQLQKAIPNDILAELTDREAALKELIPVYQKHFSEQELKDLVQFYQTPLGAKYAKALPLVQQEAIALGVKRAQSVIANFYSQKSKLPAEQQTSAGGKQ